MAQIVLGLGTSHGPQTHVPASQWHLLGEKDQRDPKIDYQGLLARARPEIRNEITPEKMQEHYEAGQRAMRKLGQLLREVSPDVVVVVGDDQHEQLLDDNMPAFCIFYGASMEPKARRASEEADPENAWNRGPWRQAAREALGTPAFYPAEPELGIHLIRSLVSQGFDVAASNRLRPEAGLGHAFTALYTRILSDSIIPMVPVMVNTFYPPNQPTPRRCYALGQALRDAIESWPSDKRVAVMASGGLSHVVIDEEIDQMTIQGLVEKDADRLCSLPVERLQLNTSEIRNWIVVAGAMEPMEITLLDYVLCYRSPAGTGQGQAFAYWT